MQLQKYNNKFGSFSFCFTMLLLLVMQKDSSEGLSVDLEEMCRKYLETW
jgi:hypothetical protein